MSLDVESSLSATSRRLTDLRDFQLPRLQKCVGPIGLYRELGEEMRVDLETVRRPLEVRMICSITLPGESSPIDEPGVGRVRFGGVEVYRPD